MITLISITFIWGVIKEPSPSYESKHRDFIFIINTDTNHGKRLFNGVTSIIQNDQTFAWLRIDVLEYSICKALVNHHGTKRIKNDTLALSEYFYKLLNNIWKSSPAISLELNKNSIPIPAQYNESLIKGIINFINDENLLRNVDSLQGDNEQKRIAVLLMPFDVEARSFDVMDSLFHRVTSWQTEIYMAFFPPVVCSEVEDIPGWENTINSIVPVLEKKKPKSPPQYSGLADVHGVYQYSEMNDDKVVYRNLNGDLWGSAVFSTPDSIELLRNFDRVNSLSPERVLAHIKWLLYQNRGARQYQTKWSILIGMLTVAILSILYIYANSWEVLRPNKIRRWVLLPIRFVIFITILTLVGRGIYGQLVYKRYIFLNTKAWFVFALALLAALPLFVLFFWLLYVSRRKRMFRQFSLYFAEYAAVLVCIAVCLWFALIPCTEFGQTFYDLNPIQKNALTAFIGLGLSLNLVFEILRLTEWRKRKRKGLSVKSQEQYAKMNILESAASLIPNLSFKNIQEFSVWGNISSRFVRPRGFDLIDFTQYNMDKEIEDIDWSTSIGKNRIVQHNGDIDILSTLSLEYPLIRNFVDEKRGEMLAFVSLGASTVLRRQAYLGEKYPISAATGQTYAVAWVLTLRRVFFDWDWGCFSARTEQGFAPGQVDEDELTRSILNVINTEMASALKHAPDINREHDFIVQMLNKANPNTDILVIADDYSIETALKIIRKYTHTNRLCVCIWIRDEMETRNLFSKLVQPRYGAFESILPGVRHKTEEIMKLQSPNTLIVQSVIPYQAEKVKTSIIRDLKRLLVRY